jgi:hypothetical protein
LAGFIETRHNNYLKNSIDARRNKKTSIVKKRGGKAGDLKNFAAPPTG